MNNEIKEILAYMKQYVENKYEHDSEPMLNYKDIKCVLDYITNLQKENENRISESLSYDLATERVKELENKITNLQEENERLKEILHWKQIENNIFYKSRIDKAIEEKKIPEKLKWVDYNTEFTHGELNKEFRNICNTIDEIIDFLKSKGE